jgi:hypothetical protein
MLPFGLKFDVEDSLFCIGSRMYKLWQEEFGKMREPNIPLHKAPLV